MKYTELWKVSEGWSEKYTWKLSYPLPIAHTLFKTTSVCINSFFSWPCNANYLICSFFYYFKFIVNSPFPQSLEQNNQMVAIETPLSRKCMNIIKYFCIFLLSRLQMKSLAIKYINSMYKTFLSKTVQLTSLHAFCVFWRKNRRKL